MTASSPDTNPALSQPPERIVLEGEGLIEEHDPHVVAQEISEVDRAYHVVREATNPTLRFSTPEAKSLNLLNRFLWDGINERAALRPGFIGKVALCLAASETPRDRMLAAYVNQGVFDAHIRDNALEAASTAAALWIELAKDPDEEVREGAKDAAILTVAMLNQKIATGSSELLSLRDKLWKAGAEK